MSRGKDSLPWSSKLISITYIRPLNKSMGLSGALLIETSEVIPDQRAVLQSTAYSTMGAVKHTWESNLSSGVACEFWLMPAHFLS